MQTTTKLLSTSSLMDDEVLSRDGEKLGHVSDLVLDMASGQIAYAVLAFGGLFGMGQKLFAVPWNAMRLEGHSLVLNVDKSTLKDAPGFDKDHWPGMDDPGWINTVHGFYGTRPHASRH